MVSSTRRRSPIPFEKFLDLVDSIFGGDMHTKRVLSLANATLGTMHAESLAIHLIGQGLSETKDLERKHCVKQVDHLFSNGYLEPWEIFKDWVLYVVGDKTEILMALDWTEFDADDHSTLIRSQHTSHGRGRPLVWLTVEKSTMGAGLVLIKMDY